MPSNSTRDVVGCIAMVAVFAVLSVPLALIMAAIDNAVLSLPLIFLAGWLAFKVRGPVHAFFERVQSAETEATESEGIFEPDPRELVSETACSNCGGPLQPDQGFCPSCSTPVVEKEGTSPPEAVFEHDTLVEKQETRLPSCDRPVEVPEIPADSLGGTHEKPEHRESASNTRRRLLAVGAFAAMLVALFALAGAVVHYLRLSVDSGQPREPVHVVSISDRVLLRSTTHTWVLGAYSNDDYDELMNAAIFQDEPAITRMVSEGRVVYIPNGSQAVVRGISANRLTVDITNDEGASMKNVVVLLKFAEPLNPGTTVPQSRDQQPVDDDQKKAESAPQMLPRKPAGASEPEDTVKHRSSEATPSIVSAQRRKASGVRADPPPSVPNLPTPHPAAFVSRRYPGLAQSTDLALMWQEEPEGIFNAEDAASYCDLLSHAAMTDWRLPTFDELIAIAQADEQLGSRAPPYTAIWSSSPGLRNGKLVLVLTSSSGSRGFFQANNKAHVICVRDQP